MALPVASTKWRPCTRTESVPAGGGGGGGSGSAGGGGGGGVAPPDVTVNAVALNETLEALNRAIAPVVASAGMVTRAWLSLTTLTPASCAAPTHAALSPLKPDPFRVTTVPTGPELGLKSW